jgi:tetratricopeptide (TPR) repeat protein
MARGGVVWFALLLDATVGALTAPPAQSQILATGDAKTCTDASGDTAIEACTRAIASNQYSGVNLGNIYFTRAVLYARKQDHDRAIADYDETVRLSPGDAQAYYNRALVHYRQRDADRAIADYSEAIRLDPAYAAAFVNRGITHITKKDYDRALKDLNEGLRLNPRDAIAFVQRARAHAARKEFNRAIADYDEAIRLNPSYAERLAAERNEAVSAAKRR